MSSFRLIFFVVFKTKNRTSRLYPQGIPRHHVINRGVNRSTVFTDDEDYENIQEMIGIKLNDEELETLEDGYTQIEIAKYLSLSRSLVSKIVREGMV